MPDRCGLCPESAPAQLSSAFQGLHGLADMPLPGLCPGHLVQGLRVRGAQLDRTTESDHGIPVASASGQRPSFVVPIRCHVGFCVDGAVELDDGVLVSPQFDAAESQTVYGSGVVSLAELVLVGPDSLPEVFLRSGAVTCSGSGIAEFAQRISEVVGDGREVNVQLQCLLILLYRFAVSPERCQGKPFPVPRIRVVAPASDG